MTDIPTNWKPIRIKPAADQWVIAFASKGGVRHVVGGVFVRTFEQEPYEKTAREVFYLDETTIDDDDKPRRWAWSAFDCWTEPPAAWGE